MEREDKSVNTKGANKYKSEIHPCEYRFDLPEEVDFVSYNITLQNPFIKYIPRPMENIICPLCKCKLTTCLQALGMLFWHKHSVDKALCDLANFTPFPDEWTVEDKVLFEQAFSFHGKSFHRIRQMVSALVTMAHCMPYPTEQTRRIHLNCIYTFNIFICTCQHI